MPAVLWIAVIALAFCFLSTHRPDRYAPIFPPLALISAYLALEYSARIRWSFTRLAIVPFVAIAIICIYFNFFDEAAVKQLGNNVVAFAKTVSQKTGDATILFEDGEQTPLQTLLGRHQPLTPPNDYLQSATWAIRFYDPNDPTPPTAVSDPIDQIVGQMDEEHPGPLALFPLAPGAGTTEFERAQKVTRLYSDEDSRVLFTNPDPAATRWLQFWRQHTVPSTTTPTSTQK
jgi:hypothetical protein